MTPGEWLAAGAAVMNFIVLLLAAWIKSDLSALKLYMHLNFVTRREYDRVHLPGPHVQQDRET